MEPSPQALEQGIVTALRRHRAELRESMSALEQALAAPTPGDSARWAQRVHVATVELSADFREHIEITEGPEGLYRELRRTAPRLSDAADRLTQEHVVIAELLEDLLEQASAPAVDSDGAGGDAVAGAATLADVERVRDLGTELLGKLVRHRQRGADMVFEAYEVDIGGET